MEAQKMKIKYVSEDTLAFLRENSKSLYEHVFVKKYEPAGRGQCDAVFGSDQKRRHARFP